MTKERFWEDLGSVRAAMLAIGDARHVPMSPYPDAETGAIWFIGAKGTDLVEALGAGSTAASLIVTGNDKLHARIEGTANLSSNRAKLEELWNLIASSWFEGIDDPDIQLIRLEPSHAEVWATDGALAFMIQIAKAQLTGDHPDMGDHYSVAF